METMQIFLEILRKPKALSILCLIVALQIVTPYLFLAYIFQMYAPGMFTRLDQVIINTEKVITELAACKRCWNSNG